MRDRLDRAGRTMTFNSRHRTLERYVSELADAGFAIDLLREHGMPAWSIELPCHERWLRIPMFLHIGAFPAPVRRYPVGSPS